jgi:hypothetical protein
VPDERWDNEELRELKTVTGAEFEAVDVSSLMLDPDSSQITPGCSEVDHLAVADRSIIDLQTFKACDEISVGPAVTVFGPDGHAALSSGNRVVIDNGLAVFPDGSLEIWTGLPLPP